MSTSQAKHQPLRSSRVSQIVFLILFMVFVVSCDKDDPIPVEMEFEQKKEKEKEIPDPITQNDITIVDSAVSSFLAKHNIPGAAIAVSVNEKMVYTKGFGLSNVENNMSTKADDVFRIASISKPFTSAAILTLLDQNKLSLDHKVFGPDGILGEDFGSAMLTANELDITVEHLLMHAGGGWSVSSGGDPIDYEPQLENNAFIEYVLNNWDLSTAPGTNFAYSNMGYWLLARIIEEVSGQAFEDYLKEMLWSTGITSLKTTTFREEDREPNEVEYYSSQEAQWIYTIASRRDGDGGIVISAPDLLRFMCAIDGKSNRSDILSSSSQNLFTTPSELSTIGRGLGTWEEQSLVYATGSLPGTRTWFYMNEENGVYAVVLLNTRSNDPEFDNDLNTLNYDLVKNAAIPWQTDLDQF